MSNAMRAITIAVLISILAGASAVAQRAAAQSAAPPAGNSLPVQRQWPTTSGMGTVPEAPIGHRQPTQSDLPPNIRKQEDSTGAEGRVVDPFAGVPNICDGC